MTTIDQQLAALRESIYIEARETVRAELRAELLTSLGASQATPTPVAKAKPASARRNGPGPKRSPEEIASTASAITKFLKERPGSGAETIKTALNVDLSTIELPIKKLLASKQIKKRGQKRATKYYPVG